MASKSASVIDPTGWVHKKPADHDPDPQYKPQGKWVCHACHEDIKVAAPASAGPTLTLVLPVSEPLKPEVEKRLVAHTLHVWETVGSFHLTKGFYERPDVVDRND